MKEGMWSLGLKAEKELDGQKGTGVRRMFLAEERRIQARPGSGGGLQAKSVEDLNAECAVSVLHGGCLMGITWALPEPVNLSQGVGLGVGGF